MQPKTVEPKDVLATPTSDSPAPSNSVGLPRQLLCNMVQYVVIRQPSICLYDSLEKHIFVSLHCEPGCYALHSLLNHVKTIFFIYRYRLVLEYTRIFNASFSPVTGSPGIS